jgi:dTDP-4-dehydrorhamnose reductase
MKNYLPRVLITGGSGQLGHALQHHAAALEFHVTACSHAELDITDITSINKAITHYSPDIIINAAAYTAVDKAEQDREACMRINHRGAEYIAQACAKYKIPLIHLSTDYVFDGTKTSPYREDDTANPVNFYGTSKWLGEQSVRAYCDHHIILRVSGIFSEYGNNFMKTMLRLAREKNELRVVADQITCPTYAGHIAGVIFSIIKQPARQGTYHYCDASPASWHEFAQAIINVSRQHQELRVETVKAIPATDYPTPARRPAYSVLDCSKIENDFGIKQAEWMQAVESTAAMLA